MKAIENQAKNLFRKLYSRPVAKIDGEFDMIEDEKQCLEIIEKDLTRIKSQLCKEQRENSKDYTKRVLIKSGLLDEQGNSNEVRVYNEDIELIYDSILNAEEP